MNTHRHTRTFGGRAFTLIELMLVLVILGLLAAVVVPRFVGQTQKGQIAATKATIDSFKLGLKMFEQACGRFPTSQEGLAALLQQPGNLSSWSGPYLETNAIPQDPWGTAYIYRCPGTHNVDYDVLSCGPDMQPDTADDIGNWTSN
ncbi:MAG: type II secretion system major pseudopilin GspG [Planctomycetaceae bacterium]|nr:type II secretion system major pseudopilin GspG [Planctomycetaceae bacterium]